MPDTTDNMDITQYHLNTLPGLLAQGREELVRAAASKLPSLGLTTANGDIAFTYSCREGQLRIERGAEQADIQILIDEDSWRGLLSDLDTAPGLLYGGHVQCLHGDPIQFVNWEPCLRALFHGIPIYDPERVDLTGALGLAHDPERRFQLDDDTELLRDYLATVGYLVLDRVFTPEELEAFRTAAQHLHEKAKEGDEHSWWGKNRDGESVLCRVLNANSEPSFRQLADDARIARLAELVPDGLRLNDPDQKDGMTLIYKNPGMVEGLSDLPWHRDCGMGGHARMCPTVVASIYLYDATDEAGSLRFLPGSHRASYGFADASHPKAPRGVRADARAGSITLHFSDVMHAAPQPQAAHGPFRQSLLMAFKPDFEHHRQGRHYNDVLLKSGEQGQVRHLKDLTADMQE